MNKNSIFKISVLYTRNQELRETISTPQARQSGLLMKLQQTGSQASESLETNTLTHTG